MSILMVRELIKQFRDMGLVCKKTPSSGKLGMLKLTRGILEDIREGQKTDVGLVGQLVLINQNKGGDFRINENGVMGFKYKVCVPEVPELKKSILEEDYRSSLSIHLGATKMYQDLKKLFWWPGMKKEVDEFIYACLTCQKSNIEHHKLLDMMQPLSIPKWKGGRISMNFVASLSKATKGCDSIWLIFYRMTKSAHFIPIRINYPLQNLVELYIEEIVSLHDISSDKDMRFTSRF